MDIPSTTTPQDRLTRPVTMLAGAVVLIVAILFISQGLSDVWYSAFKTVHVLAAIIWIGGGLLLTILGGIAVSKNDPIEMSTVARQAAFVGERLFAPAGLVVVAMGVAMMANTNWGWGKFWIVAGLLGYAITFVTGVGVLSPLSKKVVATTAEKGPADPETMALVKRLLLIARVDSMMLVLVVVDMVTKPFA